MNAEAIEPVMKEILEELKTLSLQKERETKLLEEVLDQVKIFDEKLAGIEARSLPIDLSPVAKQMREGINSLEFKLDTAPKNITRTFHFHFFPKLNIMDYYRTYSKLTLFLVILTITGGLVIIGVKWIEGFNQRKELRQVPLTELYRESISPMGNKRNKRRPIIPIIETLHQKSVVKMKSNIKGPVAKKIFLDSVKHEIQKYLSKHKLDSTHK